MAKQEHGRRNVDTQVAFAKNKAENLELTMTRANISAVFDTIDKQKALRYCRILSQKMKMG